MTTQATLGPAIRVQGLEKSYKKLEVLRGVDFDVARGSNAAREGPRRRRARLRQLRCGPGPRPGAVRADEHVTVAFACISATFPSVDRHYARRSIGERRCCRWREVNPP